ncbi:YbaB/EbfC family nucleoid-associated protein [Amycolatopsis nigrescens]|uniref:YbaB/EbfC family nucleoid-associated protein n=1 Tax=Amycolatopsis nigrescens TaxID=381445 RepID=UPI000375835F|nr:YbaB/EbfC family nucleoid-associated protein [Amycolatopsis nigrescens]
MAGPEASDLDDRAARLRARTEGIREQALRKQQALEWAQRQTAAVEGTAASGDGLIRATVDETGMLTGLELAPRVQGTQPAELARAITAVVQCAAAHARNQIRDTYAGLQNEGVITELPSTLLPAPEVGDGRITLSATAGPAPVDTPAVLRPTPEGAATASSKDQASDKPVVSEPAGTENGPAILRPAMESPAPDNTVSENPADRRPGDDGPPSTWMRRATW